MGYSINLITKYRYEEFFDEGIHTTLSKGFVSFIASKHMYKNDEFSQLEKLHNMDLSYFLNYAENYYLMQHFDLNYQLTLAKRERNEEKIAQVKAEIAAAELKREREYDEVMDGWMEIQELENVTQELLNKMQHNPDYYKQMHYNINWGNYFEPDYSEFKPSSFLQLRHSTSTYDHPDSRTLILDLKDILYFLRAVKNKGSNYVTFTGG